MKTIYYGLKNGRNHSYELIVEPWGQVLYLLPNTAYLLVCETEDNDEETYIEATEWDDLTEVYPIGLISNRLYRDGILIWDDDRPSNVQWDQLPEYNGLVLEQEV